MKKWLVLALVLCLGLSLLACGKKEPEQTAPSSETAAATETQPSETEPVHINVGISLPNDTSAYWVSCARMLKEQLEAKGYTVAVLFANNEIETQERHLREMLLNEVDCMVVAAIDSLYLTDELADAKAQGIPVVAFDRMLMDTDAVSGLITYDYETIGREMAQQVILEKKLDEPGAEKRPYTIELFMDTPGNQSAFLLHKGAMSVLQPYLDRGVLVCCSGRLDFEDTCVPEDDYDTIWTACVNRLNQEYTERELDICFAGTDIIADACRGALTVNGQVIGKHLVFIGQGGGLTGSKAVANNKQALTIYKDIETMTQACTTMAISLMKGEVPETNASQDNRVRPIPTVILPHIVITVENYTKELVETGIYTENDLPPQPTQEATEPAEAEQGIVPSETEQAIVPGCQPEETTEPTQTQPTN